MIIITRHHPTIMKTTTTTTATNPADIINNEIGILDTILTSYFSETLFGHSNTTNLLAMKGSTKADTRDN
jgi:hypothetical protein